MKTVVIIQARMGSSRLPGKVLLDLCGAPMLTRVLDRVRRASRVDEVVVATTVDPRDDVLAEFCSARGWLCFRGSENDVLDRYYRAALERQAELVVRITSDCPLIDPAIIDCVIAQLDPGQFDYVSNTIVRTYPRGLDVEAFTFSALEKAWREDQDPATREHVTQYIVRHPEEFSIEQVKSSSDASRHRWTVDTPEDFELAQRIYGCFDTDTFGYEEILQVFSRNPELELLNAHVEQKPV